MFTRLLFLTAILLQVSGCIASPRLFNNYSDEYDQPEHAPEHSQVQDQHKPQLSDEAKLEIRNRVHDEVTLQNAERNAAQPAQ